VLQRIEVYYDAAPRTGARVEVLPPFVVFLPRGGGWRYYARPLLGADSFTADDVWRVRNRQRELRVPEAFEWVAETTPGLMAAVSAAGLNVGQHPLMIQGEARTPFPEPPPGISIRRVTPEDDLALLNAVANVGFSFPGTAPGDAGPEQVSEAVRGRTPGEDAFLRDRLARELTVMAVACEGETPVAVGSHQPVGAVTEIVGVATLPAFRRRGIGAALTAFLTSDAGDRGVRTVFLSAGNEDVARVYERAGFRRIGTACIAAPAEPDGS
jgi:ribosomal protein S18 acetylase RimI-like enzyme